MKSRNYRIGSPEEKLAIVAHAESTNETLSDFIRRAFAETIEQDKANGKCATK